MVRICLMLIFVSFIVPQSYQLIEAFPALPLFKRPVDFQSDGKGNHYVVEQAGRIYLIDRANNRSLFLDIQDRVSDAGNEEGLLGLTFHPEYSKNDFFYVNYTAARPRRTVISRFYKNNPVSETVVLEINQPFSNHNGGQIAFGPDGFLYIATGDGGSGGDPRNYAQNKRSLLGKLLRIDVNKHGAYKIPEDNPFGTEVYAYGLRNPWRFSFDGNQIWLADVGQNRYEEINLIQKGKNYGWRIREGKHPFVNRATEDELIDPVWEYNHSEGMSITGGYVYRGTQCPSLKGAYIYADFVTGKIWALRYSDQQVTNRLLLDSPLNISSFGTDEDNELYLCAFNGRIYQLSEK